MAGNWNVLSGADKVRAYANNAADAGVQTSGYDDEILKEQRRRRDRDTADEIAAAQRAKYQAALAERRRAYEEALRAWGRRTDIYGQDMMDEEPVDPLAQMIDRQLMLGKGQEFPHSAPRQQGPTLDEALAIAPLEGIKGLTRGALAAPAFLGDIANLGYSGAKVLMGRPEDGVAPSEFPYGFEGATRWLANNVPGLGRDSVFEDVGSVGENIGILSPRAAILPARSLSGGLGKLFRRSPVVPELGRDLTLPRPQYAALPAPRPEMNTTRWTDLMKEINRSIDEVNTPTRIPRPRPQRGGINPAELERMQPDLGDTARTLDRINEGPRRAATQFKQLDPWGSMVDSTPIQFAGGGSVTGLARRLAQRSMPIFQDGMTPSMSPLGALSVVKPKRGNWLNGSVENALKGLKQIQPTWLPMLDGSTPTAADIEKLPDGNLLNKLSGEIMAPPTTPPIDSWIEGPLTKYVKTRMASPDDEVRLMADARAKELLAQYQAKMKEADKQEARLAQMRAAGSSKGLPPEEWQGVLERTQRGVENLRAQTQEAYDMDSRHILHTDPSDVGMEIMGRKARHDARMPIENTATTDIGRWWEDVADVAATPKTVSQELASWRANLTPSQRDARMEESPWLATLPPKTPLYGSKIRDGVNDLGFNHLIDELRNALHAGAQQDALEQWLSKATTPEEIATARRGNPVDLPRHLQLTPDAVKNMSMEKAVRRVADINAWRAAQKIEANQKIAGGPGQELVREYAHTPEKPNPKGLRWVELKKGELPPDLGGYTINPRGKKFDILAPDGSLWGMADNLEQAKAALSEELVHPELQRQLKYEGDTMGQCVGGYCDDVLSGRSRIFSLRDAKGEPHVTVEVEPNGLADPSAYMTQEERAAGMKFVNEDRKGSWRDYFDSVPGLDARIPLKITQIKGKQNRKPKDEYLPFVQDFVKNPPHGAPWGDVGDLQNSGLRYYGPNFHGSGNVEVKGTPGYYTPEELREILKGDIFEGQPLTEEYINGALRYGNGREYAAGGSVAGTAKAGWEVLN